MIHPCNHQPIHPAIPGSILTIGVIRDESVQSAIQIPQINMIHPCNHQPIHPAIPGSILTIGVIRDQFV